MRKFREFLNVKSEVLEESSNKQIAKKFMSYIGSMDLSYLDMDMKTTDGIEEYLDATEDEDDDAMHYLEDAVAPIDDIRDAMKEIGSLLKN
jgi:hypothetical protein